MADGRRRAPFSSTALLLFGLVLIALAVRLPSFGDSLWGDELSTNFVVNGFGVGSVFHIVESLQEGTPPLFFMLTWLTKGFGTVEGLRVISLLAGLGSIPLTYLLGVRTVGRDAAVVGAALLALSAFQIFYATEARAYALMLFCTLAASVTLLIAIETGRTRWWAAYALSTSAAFYTHYTSAFVLGALVVWAFLAHPEARRPLLVALLGAALLYAPWVPGLLDDRGSPAARILEVTHPLSVAVVETDLVSWAIGHPNASAREIPGVPGTALILAGVAFGAVALALRARERGGIRSWRPSEGLVLILLLALVSPVGALVHNIFAASVFIPRNLIASWPGLALAAGALVTSGTRPLRYVATGLLVAGFAIGGIKMLSAEHRRPDFAGAVDFIDRTGEANSPVVDVFPYTPGPQTNVEAAFAPRGEPLPPDRQILTLGYPTMATRLSAEHRGIGTFYPLPTPTDAQIARQAARLAGSAPIFLTVPFPGPLQPIARAHPELGGFLSALPPGYRVVGARRFPGVGAFGLTVFVLRLPPGGGH